ncbi:MAG: S41 family peptidase [Planctomycetes bacterium]|nr:S41 family peptidase [Planctomycetota bacterium]
MPRKVVVTLCMLPTLFVALALCGLLLADPDRVLLNAVAAAWPMGGDNDARTFQRVQALIARHHVDPVDRERLLSDALKGMARKRDRYSDYLTGREYERLGIDITGHIAGGLGITIARREGSEYVEVVTPIEGAPAHRAGVQSGDLIAEVDGQPAKGLAVEEATFRLRGRTGTPVRLGLLRYTEARDTYEPVSLVVTRGEVKLPSVRAAMLDDPPGVAWARVSDFQEATAGDLAERVRDLQHRGLRGLVIDLRGNPGGLLATAVRVVNLFIGDEGAVVLTTRGRDPGATEIHRTRAADAVAPDLPLVVLVDGASASASEVVAGALQDHRRALIVGSPTFGKGSVQSFWELQPDPPAGRPAALRLTTARYVTPSGRRIHHDPGAGSAGRIEPDLVVELSPQARRARDLRWERREIIPSDATRRRERTSRGADEALLARHPDLQLEAALRLLTGRRAFEHLGHPSASAHAEGDAGEAGADPEEDGER